MGSHTGHSWLEQGLLGAKLPEHDHSISEGVAVQPRIAVMFTSAVGPLCSPPFLACTFQALVASCTALSSTFRSRSKTFILD